MHWNEAELTKIIERLTRIRSDIIQLESILDLSQFGDRCESARNLIHYLGLRRYDIRDIQEKLALLGLSSLGRAEGHVLYNLDAVLRILSNMCSENLLSGAWEENEISPLRGTEILKKNSEALFGPKQKGRFVRIMVTMPAKAATDYGLVRDLLANGMDCMRINCSYESQKEWLEMISNLRKAEEELGRRCSVMMDIAGPKLRVGPFTPGPKVLKWRPQRDLVGHVTAPALIWLTSIEEPDECPSAADAVLPVPKDWLEKLSVGMQVSFADTRSAKRSIRVLSRVGHSFWADSRKTAYVRTGTSLSIETPEGLLETRIGDLQATELPIVLSVGDSLILSKTKVDGRGAILDSWNTVVEPAVICCTMPEALENIRSNERIWLDDGKIGGLVKAVFDDRIQVEITHAAEGGTKLLPNKGINLPDTDLRLPPLTPKDLEDLKFIVEHADAVGYSFVHTVHDLDKLRAQLELLGRPDMAMVVKIETRRAFEELPSLLLAAMRWPVSGVMIARGDLAVEVGYERLAEVQEEILWLCEAAHMPAIWATQVLEGLAKNGIPSRAEVTDAAMAVRAECVMLNKGPFIVAALKALDNILDRMQAHQVKKSSMLRSLNVAATFFKKVNSRPAETA
jgi:pyruvate kinase